eukprot:277941_1
MGRENQDYSRMKDGPERERLRAARYERHERILKQSLKSPERARDLRRTPSVISDTEATDDKCGLIEFRVNDYIYGRYRILGVAGQGTFGTVLSVFDTRREENLAMKVVRSVRRYLDAAEIEVKILDKLRLADADGNSHCVKLRKSLICHYRSRRHVCIVFEKLGRSLYEFLKKNRYQGFYLEQVRTYGKQLLDAVAFCHSIGLVHTDLKPENILFVSDEYRTIQKGGQEYRIPLDNEIRLIDFGGATWNKDHHARMINTRQYRAPEVILGIGWDYASDLWSVGCILAELYTGELLFGTHEDGEHLALMQKILECQIPSELTLYAIDLAENQKPAHRSRRKRRGRSSSTPRADALFYSDTGELRWPQISKTTDSKEHVASAKTLDELIPDADFLDLLRGLLTYHSKRRLSAKDALTHKFFAPLNDLEEDR